MVSPAPREAWTAVWDSSPQATIFHRPEWLDACCLAERFEDASRLYEAPDGTRIVLPLVRRGTLGSRREQAWSMPTGWGLGGAFASRPLGAWDVAMMLDDLRSVHFRLMIRPDPVNGAAWSSFPVTVRVRHDAHVVDLRQGFGKLWSGTFSSDTRNKIRKAEKRGVEVTWRPGTELMDVYWDLFMRWTVHQAKERGIPVPLAVALAQRREPLTRYQAIARELGEGCQIVLARVHDEPAASVIALLGGVHAHYWRATSDRRALGRSYANPSHWPGFWNERARTAVTISTWENPEVRRH